MALVVWHATFINVGDLLLLHPTLMFQHYRPGTLVIPAKLSISTELVHVHTVPECARAGLLYRLRRVEHVQPRHDLAVRFHK